MSRRSAREKAMQLLYQLESQKGHALEQIDLFLEERAPLPGAPRLVEPEEEGQGSAVEVLDEDDRAYIKALALGVLAKADELDRLYGPYLKNGHPRGSLLSKEFYFAWVPTKFAMPKMCRIP
jgi:transcription termination factor NusB